MNYTYNGLPFRTPTSSGKKDWIAYFDVEFRVLSDEEIILVDATLSGLSMMDKESEEETVKGADYADARVRASLQSSFESAFENGDFQEPLLIAAYKWGYDPEDDRVSAPLTGDIYDDYPEFQ